MKKLALVTFDIVREKEPEVAFSVASILSYLKGQKEYGDAYDVHHISINLFKQPQRIIDWNTISKIDWHNMDYIAVSCYVWSYRQSLSLMKWIKKIGIKGKIIAGGYQINVLNKEALNALYPDADNFILGYAEQALYETLITNNTPVILQSKVDFGQIPSPFCNGIIPIDKSVSRIRLETKRGCPYQCTFCAQHDLDQRKVYYYLEQRLLPELSYLSKFSPERISVTDPVFNMGNSYIQYLQAINQLGMKGVFNFQVRPEIIAQKKDELFLDLIAETGSEIELGLQTFDEEVNVVIKRRNNYQAIDHTLHALLDRGIKFGISLIYGLPKQTLKSFENDINKLKQMGITNVVAYPLMFLPGTEMYNQRHQFHYKEMVLGEYNIPHVVETSSFTYSDWRKMHELAESINPSGRLF